MKTSYLLLAFITVSAFSQAPSIDWQKTYGGYNYDALANIKQTPDGGFIFTGKSESPISGDKTVNNKGAMDIWLIKTDALGQIQWQKDIGGSGSDEPTTILFTSDDGYLVGALSSSDISGDQAEGTNGFRDIWILKLDSSGNIEWQNTIGGSYTDIVRSIIETSDGGYLIGANSVSSISGDKTEDNIGYPFGLPYYTYYDYWLIKIDALGNIEWDNTIGSKLTDTLTDAMLGSDGGYFVCGSSFCDNSGDYVGTGFGGYDFWLLKLDLQGNILWQKTIGGALNDRLQSVIPLDDGGYLLGGISNSGISGNKSENSKGGDDFWIVKIDVSGNVLWDKTIGGSAADSLYGMTIDNNGNCYLLGPSNSNISGDKTENSRGGKDNWLIKTDSNGNVLWDKTIGGAQDDESGAIAYLEADDSVIIGGQSYSSASGDKTEESRGNADYWVVKLASDQLNSQSFTGSAMLVYPNPTTKTIHVHLPKMYKTATVSITTVTGQVIHNKALYNITGFDLDIEGEAGLYFVNLTTENNEKQTFKVIKE